MKVNTSKEVVVTLALTEDEAKMLMGMVQNPMCDPSDEPTRESDFRYQLFEELKAATSR